MIHWIKLKDESPERHEVCDVVTNAGEHLENCSYHVSDRDTFWRSNDGTPQSRIVMARNGDRWIYSC